MLPKKFSLLLIFSIILTLGLSISLGSLLAAWTAPASSPPEGNIAAPINTGATLQAKQVGLWLNYLPLDEGGSANGLLVQYGNVGIGTTTPQAKLEVVGNIIADAPTASNEVATKGYVDASGGSAGLDQYYESWCAAHQGQKCARSGTMDYKCMGDFCTKAGISNDMDEDGVTGATDCNDSPGSGSTIGAAADGTCDGDADGKIDVSAYLTTPKPAEADCYDSNPAKYSCLSNGTTCSSGIYCASTYCVDGYCCESTCTGQTCQTCGIYSSAGAGKCGYVNNSLQDPHNNCSQGSTASDGCSSNNCSGTGYSCGTPQTSGYGGCPTCGYCNGASIACTAYINGFYDSRLQGCKTCNGTIGGFNTMPDTNWGANQYNCAGSSSRCVSGNCRACDGYLYSDGCNGCAGQGGQACWRAIMQGSCDDSCNNYGGCIAGGWNDDASCSVCKHIEPAATECITHQYDFFPANYYYNFSYGSSTKYCYRRDTAQTPNINCSLSVSPYCSGAGCSGYIRLCVCKW